MYQYTFTIYHKTVINMWIFFSTFMRYHTGLKGDATSSLQMEMLSYISTEETELSCLVFLDLFRNFFLLLFSFALT